MSLSIPVLRSEPCTYCGGRIIVAPGFDRVTMRRDHEARCALGRDCGRCEANIGQPCTTPSGKRTTTHSSRRLVDWIG